jgi:hypothetical protein
MPSWSAEIQAQINSVQTYQHETYTFLRYCEHYIVGYSTRGVQIIKGKCHYGGIRDLGGTIGGHYPGDLPAWIGGVEQVDLGGEIIGEEEAGQGELGAIIGAHPPEDLGAIIAAHLPEDLAASIRGFDFRDLSAYITALQDRDLTAEILPVPPRDLSAYLKVWPQEDLIGIIHGWDTKDLSAYMNIIGYADLPAIIGTHRPKILRAWIKGWVREATSDLGASIHSFVDKDLGAFIRSSEMLQLPAYIFAIIPRNLQGVIHGWQEANLTASISSDEYPGDLPASLNITGQFTQLTANIHGKVNQALPTDLSAYILITQGRSDLSAYTNVKQARDLTASIDSGRGVGDLLASIYPKRIRLTGILSVVTMEHRDMSATISIPCFYSNLSDLSAYIRPVFKGDLSATLNAKGYVYAQSNLGASIGYADNTMVQDRLAISILIKPRGYRTEDKIKLLINVHRAGLSLGASITGVIRPEDLSAYINGVDVLPYNFETWKGSEIVFDTTYTQQLRDYQNVDIMFKSIVKDYYYASGSHIVAPVDRHEGFVVQIMSTYSPTGAARRGFTLHKLRELHDMRKYGSMDEAIRDAIWYVTTDFYQGLGAYINGVTPRGNSGLAADIVGLKTYSTDNNLTSSITGTFTHTYDIVVGYTNDGVDFLDN